MTMTAQELAKKVTKIAKEYKTCYIWGGLGKPITAATIKQAVNQYPKNASYEAKANALAGQKKAFYFDCVGLVKSVLWGWNGNSSKNLGGATYASNGVPDISADQMITKCKEVSTSFSKIEVGELLWCKGHVGIYIGEGLAVECTPKWENGVQITAVCNIGSKYGYKSRVWTKHGKLPYVTYTKTNTSTTAKKTSSAAKLDAAQAFSESYANTYTVNAVWLNLRKGAGTTKGIVKTLPKGRKVTCFGYYTKNGSTPWLYVKDQKTGAIGFCSKKYLK